jgi:uncharacterized protein (DUF1778 family)
VIHRAAPFVIALVAAIVGPAAVPMAAAQPADPVAPVIELLSSAAAEERAIGLERVRYGIRGEATTARLANLLPGLGAAAQNELVLALGARGDRAALPAVRTLLESSKDAALKNACLTVLGMLGGPAEVPVLVGALAASEPERTGARQSLLLLDPPGSDAAILAAAAAAAPDLRSQLWTILTERNAWGRLSEALPQVVASIGDGNAAVRKAALAAVAQAGAAAEVPGIVKALLAAPEGQDRNDIERTLVTVCTRGRDSARSAAAFFGLFTAATDADRETLVAPLGRIGGPQARGVVDALIDAPDPARRRSGIEAIVRWPDAGVADRLLSLTDSAADPAERDRLLNALIRIGPQPDNGLNEEKKLELLQKTIGLCRADKDRARVLERAHAIRTIASFRFVVPYLDQPALAEAAARSVVELAHHRQLRDAHKDEFIKALDRVPAVTQDAELRERAEAYKQGRTWKRQ